MATENTPPVGLALTDNQRLDWIRLTRTDGVGPRTFRTLINRFGGAEAALEALPGLLASQGRSALIVSKAEAERELETARRYGVSLIGMGEPDYPPLLRMIDSPPPLVGIRGDAALFRRNAVGIVGSRNASASGLKMAETLARELGRAHCAVISGLARGIDARAHRASLATGTVAVLAGGHDRIYPAEHAELLDEILQNGAAISEMPMGWEPRGRDFPRRNRIISGLSHGVIGVEAAIRSGSLITARFAAEQGRDVFAVPGSPLDPRSEGTNDLIREGATLIASATHVLQALAPVFGREIGPPSAQEDDPNAVLPPLWDELDLGEPTFQAADAGFPVLYEFDDNGPGGNARPLNRQDRDIVLELLGPSPLSVDDLIRLSSLSARAVHLILFELELERRLERHGGGLFSLIPPAT